jgi:hypothetical protein
MNVEQPTLIRLKRPRRVDRWNMIIVGLPLAAFEMLNGLGIATVAVNLVPVGISEFRSNCGNKDFGMALVLLVPCLAAGWGLDAFLARRQWPREAARLALVAASAAWAGAFLAVSVGNSFLRG